MSNKAIFFLWNRERLMKSKRGIRIVRRLAVLGIALGVATLMLTQSVLSGFEKVFHQSILGFNAHLVLLFPREREPLDSEKSGVLANFKEEALAYTPFLYRETLLISQGRVKGAVLKGIDAQSFGKVYDLRLHSFIPGDSHATIQKLLESDSELPSLVLGSDLAKELGIQGHERNIQVFLPQSSQNINKSLSFQSFRVTGIFTSGLYEFDHGFAFADLSKLRKLFASEAQTTGWEFRLKHPMQAEDLARRIQPNLSAGDDLVSWQRLNAPLFRALKIERSLFFVMMSMVVAVAAFNVVGVLLLMIFEKNRQISILRALGLSFPSLKRLFSWQGLAISALGCGVGIAVGATLAWTIEASGIFKLAKEVYFIEELPIDFSWTVLASVVGMSLAIAYLVTRFAVMRLKKLPLDL